MDVATGLMGALSVLLFVLSGTCMARVGRVEEARRTRLIEERR